MTFSETDRQAAAQEALQPMDETAFRAFYDRTSRRLWLYLCRITDSSTADDLLQEAYYRFYRAGAVHDDETHRRNSLFRIATNLVHDSRRTKKRGTHVSLDGEFDLDSLPDDDRTARRVEGRTDLHRAMARLSPSQQEMLWLAYGLGSSHAEIAETVGVKTASVKLLLFRARRKLAELLGGRTAGGDHASV